jgi:hypothetical protein
LEHFAHGGVEILPRIVAAAVAITFAIAVGR